MLRWKQLITNNFLAAVKVCVVEDPKKEGFGGIGLYPDI